MTAKQYEREIKKNMRALGVYRAEFNRAVGNLAKIYVDMDTAREQFEKSGSNVVVAHTNKSGATNFVKNPFFLAIEGLQGQILAYSRELGLTPAGFKKLNEGTLKEGGTKGLAAVLAEIKI